MPSPPLSGWCRAWAHPQAEGRATRSAEATVLPEHPQAEVGRVPKQPLWTQARMPRAQPSMPVWTEGC
jgi:hypothetical protein